MPTRLLREGILDSERVCSLSFPAEVFYRRLMSVVDDFGRFDGRASVLRSRLYPLQTDKVREADISRWIAECEKAGLIALYAVAGKPYILFGNLGTARAKESKYPPPPAGEITSARTCTQTQADENDCTQTRADVPDSDSDSDSDSGRTPSESCPEPPKPASSGPPVLTFPTVGTGAREWPLTAAKLAEWAAAFPGVDVLAECRKARQWCVDNPARRKTPRGMAAFLGRWLGKAQEKSGGARGTDGPGRRGGADARSAAGSGGGRVVAPAGDYAGAEARHIRVVVGGADAGAAGRPAPAGQAADAGDGAEGDPLPDRGGVPW